MTIYDVIQKPLLTEKGVTKKDTENTLCFAVDRDAMPNDIKLHSSYPLAVLREIALPKNVR